MSINYEDERFQDVKAEEKDALEEVQQTYDGMLDKAESFYEGKASEIDQWTQKQQTLQQEQTDFAVEQLQQQKDQAKKDYIKEQSGAYTDWKKQSSQHGVAAEQMAGAGLAGSGYSESSQVAMYTAYQSRVATARESFNQAVLTYDNAMKDARLQGSAAMAEIALQGFQQQLELSLQGFQYENQLIQQLLVQKQQTQDRYYGRWQDLLAQLNSEAALAEQIRQYNESMAFQQKEYEEGVRRFNEELAETQRQFNEQMALKQGGAGSTGSTGEVVPQIAEQTEPFVVADTAGNLNQDGSLKGGSGDRSGNRQQEQPPNRIAGHGKLVDIGDKVDVEIYQNGQWVTVEQSARKAEDGTLWVWNPTQAKYIQIGTDKSWANTDKNWLSTGNGGLMRLSKYGEIQSR